MTHPVLLLLLLCLAAAPVVAAPPSTLTGKVVSVSDGDTSSLGLRWTFIRRGTGLATAIRRTTEGDPPDSRLELVERPIAARRARTPDLAVPGGDSGCAVL